MPLDYFRLPIFQPGGTGIGQFGNDLADAAGIFVEGRHRKRQEELARQRQDALEAHQRALEAADAQRNQIAEKRQLAAEDFTRRQSDVAERRASAQEQRDALTFEQGQADRRAATVRDIGKAFGGGRPMQAQAIAGSSQFVDPRTGQTQGVRLEEAPPPPDSGMAMPIEPKQPEFVGPLEDPESARIRAIGRYFSPAGGETQPPQFDPAKADEAERAGAAAASEVSGQQALRDQYGREAAAYPGQRAAYDAAESEHAARVADPRYRASFPTGESVEIDPREERKAVLAEAKDKADRLRQGAAQQPPDVARSMMLQADLIESTISNADKAPVTNMNSATQAQVFKAGESEKDRASREKIASVRHAGKALGGGRAQQVGLAELIRMKEQGAPDSEIATRAAQLGIPAGGKAGWLQSTKEVVRGGEIGKKRAERDASLQITGPNGEAGTAKSQVEAKRLNDKNAAFAQLKTRLQALMADVQENGQRVLMPGAQQRRNSLVSAFNSAARVYNGLGGTDASQRLEAEITGAAGTLGHGFLVGANPEVLQHLMQEAETQHRANMQIRTRQPAGGGAAAGGGTRKVRMPDGSVQEFDASGRRIK